MSKFTGYVKRGLVGELVERVVVSALIALCFVVAHVMSSEIFTAVVATVLSGIILAGILYLSREFWMSLYDKLKRKHKREEPSGRVVSKFHLKNGGLELPYFEKWQVWSLGEDEVEPDPFYPESFSAGAQVSAKSVESYLNRSEGNHTGLKLTAQCYTESPGKVFFRFANEHAGNLGDAPYIAIKFGDEKPINFALKIPAGSPRDWNLYEEDYKLIESALQRHPRMSVRWRQYKNDQMETVTAEFDLEGWNDAFAEIKRRFDKFAPNGW